MDFKKWDNIINTNKWDMLFLIIYYNLKCNEIKLNDNELNLMINAIYNAYMKDENHLDLGFITDIAVKYKNEILNNNNFIKWDLLAKCYEEI